MATLPSGKDSAQRSALRIAALYVALATIWIVGSDQVVGWFTRDLDRALWLETAKGCAFVGITGLLLYALIRHDMRRILRSERRYRALFDASQDALFVSDAAGHCLHCNAAALRLTGYRYDELHGRQLITLLTPDMEGRLSEHLPHSDGDASAPAIVACKLATKHHGQVPIEASISSLTFDETDAYLAVVRDVSSLSRAVSLLEQSEARFTKLIEAAPMGIAMSRAGQLTYVNPRYLHIFGYDRPDELVGQPLTTVIAPECRAEMLERNQRRERGELAASVFESVGLRKDGTTFPFRCDANLLELNAGLTTVVFVRDITEQQRVQAALRTSEERFRTVVSNAPLILFALDTSAHFTVVEGKALRRLGLLPEALRGRSFFEVYQQLTGSALDGPDNTVQRALAGHEHSSIDMVAGRIFQTYWRPLRDDQQQVSGVTAVAIDITEQRQAEEALRRSEQKLSLHVQHTPLAYIEWDLDFRVVEWNPAAEQVFGYTRAEALGRSGVDLIVPEPVRAAVLDVWKQLISDGGGSRSSNDNLTKSGQLITCEWYNTPLVDGEGHLIGVASLAQDVTARVQAEVALRRSEAMYRALVNALPDLMFRLSRGAVFLDWQAGRNYEPAIPPSNFIGRHVTDVLPPPVAQAALEHIALALESGTTQVFEYQLPSSDGGTMLDYEARVVVSGDDEIVAIVRDITDRKRIERTLRDARDVYLTLVEEAPILVWRTDKNGHCDFVNRRWIEFTGLAEHIAPVTQWLEPLHPDDRDRFVATTNTAIAAQHGFEAQFRLQHADGTYRWIEAHATPFFDERHCFAGLIATGVDISERKRQEQIKDDFLALASHELKTPLAALVGYIHLLERWAARDQVGDRVVQALQAMSNEGARLDRLINDLLDVSRIQTGRLRMHMQTIELRSMLPQLVDSIQQAVPDHCFVLSPLPEAELWIDGDAQRIEQVLTNLLTNAAKYSYGSTPVHIDVYAGTDYVEIAIRDAGVGIPPSDIPHIFDRFYQVQRPARESRPGLGLGLYIVQEIVRQHGGSIRVESVVDLGSRFVVRLPCVSGPSKEHTPHASGMAQPS